MGLFDKFKKTEKVEKGKKKAVQKRAEIKIEKVKKPVEKISAPKISKKEFSGAWKILSKPLVTEKSAALNADNQYVFKVTPEATKNEIKKAIRDLYGVKVEKVNIINLPGKTRRVGRNQGFRPGFKKAIISVAKGQSIEIISG